MITKKYTKEEYQEAAILWKEKNPEAELIPQRTKIVIKNGKEVPVGKRLHHMRKNLEKLTQEEKEFWGQYGLNAPILKDEYKEEEYQEAAILWRKENPDTEMVPRKEIITIASGKKIPLGTRMNYMRRNLDKLTEKQKEFWSSYGLFATNQSTKDRYTEEEYQEAAILWRKENPSAELITQKTVITIANGKKIPLGTRMNNMRLNKIKLTEEEQEFWSSYGLFAQGKKIKEQQIMLKKYTKILNGDLEKAKRVVRILNDIRTKRKSNEKEEVYIESILKEFNIDFETLIECLHKTQYRQVNGNIHTIEYKGKTLKQICKENNFNCDVINRAFRLHRLGITGSLEDLANREFVTYYKKGRKEPSTWIYEKYSRLIKEILRCLKLDAKNILKDMTNFQITLEEAIKHEVFKNMQEKEENCWLEEIYKYLIEQTQDDNITTDDLANKFVDLVKQYGLTTDEVCILQNSFSKYIKTIKEYQLVSVGLETNEQRKLEKIKDYKLKPEDIEESFYIPLEFDKNELLGRKSELYKRRQLLRQYIIDWDYYTEEEKQETIIDNKFTEEELNKIEKTRNDINKTITKVKMRGQVYERC